jgi:CarD family transcriptional regulator
VIVGEYLREARESRKGEVGMFKQGDAVVHPARGAGIVTAVEEREIGGTSRRYYMIDLVDGLRTHVMVPVSAEESLGLRAGIGVSQLTRVWRVLRAKPKQLPADYKERNRLLDERLAGGNILDVAAVVRDVTDRERQQGELTIVTKRHLTESMSRLAGEIAAAQGVDRHSAEVQIRARLRAQPGGAGVG